MDSLTLNRPLEVRLDLSNPLSRGYDRGRPLWYIALWGLVQTWLIHTSPHFAMGWRRFLYRLFGAQIGTGVRIGHSAITHYPWKLTLGDHVWIGDEAHLYSMDHITIESNAVVSQRAYLCTGTHDATDPTFPVLTKPIVVKKGAWVALGAVVMPGVTVGEGAVVGVSAVLTKSADPWGVYLGIPAVYKSRRVLQEPSTALAASTSVPAPMRPPEPSGTSLTPQRPRSGKWPSAPSQPMPERTPTSVH